MGEKSENEERGKSEDRRVGPVGGLSSFLFPLSLDHCYILRFPGGLLAGVTMPLYEYACDSCGETIEALQRFSDPPLETCGSCGGSLEKLISAPSIQFKGSGWYVTDYARKDASPKNTETTKAEPAKTNSESSTNKSDAKKES